MKSNNIYLTKFVIYFGFCFLVNGVGFNFDTKGANTITTFINVGRKVRNNLEFRNWQKFANMPRKF